MTVRTQKILVIVGFIAVTVGIATGLYFTFFRSAPVPVTSPTITDEGDVEPARTLPSAGILEEIERLREEEGAGELPVSLIAAGGITETKSLTLTGTKSPTLSADGRSLSYYDPSDGKFYAVDGQGNIRSLLRDSYPNADDITWSGDTSKAVLEFPDGANIMLDFQTGDSVTLPQHWEEFDFSPDSNQLVTKSIGVDPSNRWLVVSNPDGSQADTIAALGNNQDKVQVNWSPNNQVVAFSDTGAVISGFGRKQILPIGKHQENLPGLVVEGFSFDAKWSTDGSQILYNTAGPSSSYQPQLWLVDGDTNTMGNNRRSLPLNTWADKCTYSDSETAYCAVPQNLPAGSGLQRVLALGEPDSVYRINTKTGYSELVAVPESNISMTSLTVSEDGSTLFFQNEISGTLEQIRLR